MIKFGWVGKSDIEEAINKLEEYSILYKDYLFWMEKPHTGDRVRGEKYHDIFSLSDVSINKYSSIDELKEAYNIDDEEIEDDDTFKDISNMIKNKNIVYEVYDHNNNHLFDNLEDAEAEVFDLLQDGRGVRRYDYDELLQTIKECLTKNNSDCELEVKFVLEVL
jgi:hypothetical protein